MPQFEQIPPPAAVAADLKAVGCIIDERDPPGYVRIPGKDGSFHWTEANTWMRRWCLVGIQLAKFKQSPWWRSPTFLAFFGGLATLITMALALILDPAVAEWIPPPYNKILPVLITLGVVPKMQKWLTDHRAEQEADNADQRRMFALAMLSAGDIPPEDPPSLPPSSR